MIRAQSLEKSASGRIVPQRHMLRSYEFRFKCDERAEKRNEFYSNLKEKMQKKEVERIASLEKSKEIQEAEIKMLRKASIFKANPMPSFYYETTLSKVELKKTPPTRARSPKFSSRTLSIKVKSEETLSHNSRMSHKSQDEKTNKIGINKGSSSGLYKRPFRKFLTKFPAEQSRLAHAKKHTAPSVQSSDHLNEKETGLISGPSES